MSSIEDWDLTSVNLARVESIRYEVAVLPVAAVEAHNRHLPYGQDLLHTTHVSRECCRRAWNSGARVVWLPPLPYGVDCNLMDFPLVMHVSQQTIDAMVRDLIASCRRHGIRKFVIVNGHGGNAFLPLVRQVQCDLDVHVFACDWWKVGRDRFSEIFDQPDDHAGQFETSVALALFPQLVEPANAKDGAVKPFRFEALRKDWVQTSRRFSLLNDHCAAGNPAGASAEKGKAYLEVVYSRLSAFLIELSGTPIDATFPMLP